LKITAYLKAIDIYKADFTQR